MKDEKSEIKIVEALFRKLTRSPRQEFPTRPRDIDAPKDRGVYVISDCNGRVVHVGRTPFAKKGIYQRLCDHMGNRSSFTFRYLNGNGSKLSRQKYGFQWIVVVDDRARALLEAYAIGHLCPAHLGIGQPRVDAS